MKIIFLGCGYLGYNLSKHIRVYGDTQIWGLKSPYSEFAPWFKEINAFDIDALLREDLKDSIIVDTISLIGNNDVSDDEDSRIHDLVSKYRQLFLALKEKQIKRYIYFSSGGTIYGESDFPIDETHPLNPLSLYAKSKMALENELIKSGLEYLILRPTNPYGGYQITNGQGVIPILINASLNHTPFTMWVEETSVRDYIYIDDFANALKLLIEKNITNEIVNISSGIGTSLQEVISTIEADTCKNIIIKRVEDKPTAVESIVLSNEKLKKLTGYEPSISLVEGINKEVQRIKEI